MIRIETWPDETTRTPNDGCYWYAACDIEGQHYEARSRRGPTFKLARLLVSAGVEDDQVEIYNRHHPLPSGGPSVTARSFHKALAPHTLAESARSPIRKGKFVDISARIGSLRVEADC